MLSMQKLLYAPVECHGLPRLQTRAACGHAGMSTLLAPAPRFSRTEPEARPVAPADNASALAAWGFSKGDIEALQSASAF